MWALMFYCVTQGPMLGLKNINYFQFAYVADHYFYHGAVGLMLMLAIGADLLRRKLGAQRGRFVTVGVCALALGWGARTFFYVEHWENAETFWARVLGQDPGLLAGMVQHRQRPQASGDRLAGADSAGQARRGRPREIAQGG
jgi:hypothetical protein